jgi:acetylornithine deacetylase/succinyl-diaminopimelate desuccinylase-like protein
MLDCVTGGPATPTSNDLLAAAWEAIDSDFDSRLEVIRAYLRQPSVSRTGEGIEEGAAATAALIEATGGHSEIVQTPGHPAVIGTIEGAGPTLLRYGMYDVQPADEPGWSSPPFAAEVRSLPGRGQCVVARGASNSKGCLAAFLIAVAAMRTIGDLPAGLVLLVEGEEELGSPNLPAVIAKRRADLAADAAFDLDLTADLKGVPDVYLGCKGILSLRLSCSGGSWGGPAERALHSSQGVVISSPAWSLTRALCALVDADEGPLIPGLRAMPPPEEDEELVDGLVEHFEPNDHLVEAGAARHKGRGDVRSIVNSLLYEPAVNLNGVTTGYPDGGKTIIPNNAHAAIDLRMPHGNDPGEVAASVAAVVNQTAPEVDVEVLEFCPPSRTSASSAVARAMVASHEDAGHVARVWPSAPWWAPYHLFEQTLRMPFAIGGAGHSARAHAADEYATVEGLREHMRQSIAFLHRFAEEAGATGDD